MFTLPAPVADAAALVARLLLGVVLIAHGWQKVATNGLAATTDGFAALGVPLPGVAATLSAAVELGGGALLIVGLATPVVGLLVVLNMIGAGVFAGHFTSGVLVTEGGWELVGVIAAGALLLIAFGPGRYSVDHLLAGRRTPAPV